MDNSTLAKFIQGFIVNICILAKNWDKFHLVSHIVDISTRLKLFIPTVVNPDLSNCTQTRSNYDNNSICLDKPFTRHNKFLRIRCLDIIAYNILRYGHCDL